MTIRFEENERYAHVERAFLSLSDEEFFSFSERRKAGQANENLPADGSGINCSRVG